MLGIIWYGSTSHVSGLFKETSFVKYNCDFQIHFIFIEPLGYLGWAATFMAVGLVMESFMQTYYDSLESEKDRLVLRRTLRLEKEQESHS